MLLTITYTGKNTQNLGFLLHKNPYRAQQFELSFGKAYVFYPEVTEEKTTAALLLYINPIDLAKGKQGSGSRGIFDYVNDRPYVASSFMSSALVRVFSSAMKGRCDKMQELADTPIDLRATIYSLPCRGNKDFLNEVFEPLGYKVEYRESILDENFPEWGDSVYVDLTIEGKLTLSALLSHLYVLIPVFDRQKHYWIDESEIDKLLKYGEGWLAKHPARSRIINRYMSKKRGLAYKAMDRLFEEDTEHDSDEAEEQMEMEVSGSGTEKAAEDQERRVSLNTRRLEAVRDAVLSSGATSVIDLGCGEGKLISMLLDAPQIRKVTGVDVMVSALEKARSRLRYDRMPPYKKDKLTLMQASLTYRDDRFKGYDAACIIEVIEHLDPYRLSSFERIVFRDVAPATVILTTPNKEYNIHYDWVREDTLRHGDHRFEWSRAEFREWTEKICETYGYFVTLSEIGDVDETYGTPTQMGVFQKCV